MTNEQTTTIGFQDQAGDYYLVPQAVLEQGRVPVERRAEVERRIADAQNTDVQGYIWQLAELLHLTPIFVIAGGAYLVYDSTQAPLNPGLHR